MTRRIFYLAIIAVLFSTPVVAATSGCVAAADVWIDAMKDGEKRRIYHDHARTTCRFSGQWIKAARDDKDPERRQRMCRDLVLIWAHKECNFFRDVIDPEAYKPCKAWTREMFGHCMDNDVDWFP